MAHRKRPADLPEGAGAAPSVEPSGALWGRILESIADATRFEGFVERFALLFDLSLERAREVLRAADAVRGDAWEEQVIPGVRLSHFAGGERVASADCGLVQLDPGTVFPSHRHRGAEWVFVLSGSAEEDSGDVWLPGDVIVREPGSVHGYRAIGDEPYLFGVVLHGGIELA